MIERTGDWDKLKNIMTGCEQRLEKYSQQALLKAAVALESLIKARILQSKDMQPLHSFTQQLKGSHKPLIDQGDLLGSVSHRFVDESSVFVGVHRMSVSGVNIAAIHERESGTRIRVTPKMRAYLHSQGLHLRSTTMELFIPGRPFIKPAYQEFKDKRISEKLFSEAVSKTLYG